MKKLVAAIALVASLAVSHEASAIERQNTMNWCWASAIQEVLTRHDAYVPQPNIVARLTGRPQDRPAYTAEVAMLLRSYGIGAPQMYRPATPQELYQTLASGNVIVALVRPSGGAEGHFVVFEGVDARGNVLVADPWTATTLFYPMGVVYGWNWADAVVTR